MKHYIPFIGAAILLTGSVAFFAIGGGIVKSTPDNRSDQHEATIYRAANCSCCGLHSAYLKRSGFRTTDKLVDASEIVNLKAQYGVPQNRQSCHTTVIDGYVVEGHVPIEAINDLLETRPDIAGIGLANMPSGSPGMPGRKIGPFDVYAFDQDGAVTTFGLY
ncbi:MAG: DUF411 domain-containing protein [Candidatus Uhrbacteria bacterium]